MRAAGLAGRSGAGLRLSGAGLVTAPWSSRRTTLAPCLTLGLCASLFVLAGCADGTDPEHGKLPAERTVSGPVEARSGEAPPQRPAALAQSISRAAFRDELTAAAGRWVVSRMANPQGAFVLVRNVTAGATEAATILVVHGEGGGDTLGPRETRVWKCDGYALPVAVSTNDGTAIFDASLECGDALYVRLDAAVSDALH